MPINARLGSRLSSLAVAVGLALVALLPCSSAHAVTLNSTSRGYYYDSGAHDPTNFNYIAGQLVVDINPGFASAQFRDFFVFDLAGVAGPITSATLSLYLPPGDDFGFATDAASETFNVFAVGVAPDDVATDTNAPGTYIDLGTGLLLGSRVITAADRGTFVDIVLNANALALIINPSLGGKVVFGGAVSTISSSDHSEFVFGGTPFQDPADGSTKLILASDVPEPLTVLLLGSSLFGVAGIRRRRRG